MKIERANLFRTGQHHKGGDTFSESDLDVIVQSFDALKLAGRVPLKFGHDDAQPFTDGMPALGWVQRVWREGADLFADLTDIPNAVFSMIQKGLYKFTSIELLKDAVQSGKSFAWVLDAVALLGAEPPAVSGLEDLQKLTLSRDSFKFAQAVSFTRAFNSQPVGARKGMDQEMKDAIDAAVRAASAPLVTQVTQLTTKVETAEADKLKFKADLDKVTAENTALKTAATEAEKQANATKVKFARDAVTEILEAAVRAKKILPARRLHFTKLLNVDDDAAVVKIAIADVEALVDMKADEAKKVMMSKSAANRDPNDPTAVDGEDHYAETLAQKVNTFARAGKYTDSFTAFADYMQQHPADGRAFTAYCFDGTVQ